MCSADQRSCVCHDGWGGADCSVSLLQPDDVAGACSSTAIVDTNGVCCDVGAAIDSVTGVCCGDGVEVDGAGRCCNVGETVDACGVCGGDGVVVDVSGVCCSRALAPSGECCEGWVDSCGVCSGTNSCEAVVTFPLPPNANASAASVASALGFTVGNIVNFTVVSDAARHR